MHPLGFSKVGAYEYISRATLINMHETSRTNTSDFLPCPREYKNCAHVHKLIRLPAFVSASFKMKLKISRKKTR